MNQARLAQLEAKMQKDLTEHLNRSVLRLLETNNTLISKLGLRGCSRQIEYEHQRTTKGNTAYFPDYLMPLEN